MADPNKTVVFSIVSTAPDSTDSSSCRVVLNDIWVSRGGRWGAEPDTMAPRGIGPWRASPQDPNDVLGFDGPDETTRYWIIKGTASPLTVGQSGSGKMEIGTGTMPVGSFTWKIVFVSSMSTASAVITSDSDSAGSGDGSDGGDSAVA
jgi:hypothetical protein